MPTFGYRPVLVTRSDVPESLVYALVKSVFENLEQFKRLHPAFKTLDRTKMTTDSLAAPLHEGAARYYREAGLL